MPKSKFSEGGRLTGSVAGGSLGGAGGAYLTCNLIFGLPSGGTSILWCSIVAGAAGGYVVGKVFSNGAQMMGESIYEKTYHQ